MKSIQDRLDKLQTMQPTVDNGRAFLWYLSQPLAAALARSKVSLKDAPLFSIRIEGVKR